MSTFKPHLINGQPLSPVHYSERHGIHADIGIGPGKAHVPFVGQTTLPTFKIGGSPGHNNDANLALLGGSFRNIDITGGK